MASRRLVRVALLVTLASVGAALLAAEGTRERIQVVFPPDHAVLPPGELHIIARGEKARLVVDGRSRAWEPFRPPLRVARVSLSSGRHEVRIGDRRFRIAVVAEGSEAPDGWERIRRHPIDTAGRRCAGCHETRSRGSLTEVGAPSPAACRDCHTEVDLNAAHSHPMKPLEHCPACHAPHASPRKSLLRAPAKTLCAACHES